MGRRMLDDLLVVAVDQAREAHSLGHHLQFALAQLVLFEVHHLHLDAALLEVPLRLLHVEVLLADVELDVHHVALLRTSSPRNCRIMLSALFNSRDATRSV